MPDSLEEHPNGCSFLFIKAEVVSGRMINMEGLSSLLDQSP